MISAGDNKVDTKAYVDTRVGKMCGVERVDQSLDPDTKKKMEDFYVDDQCVTNVTGYFQKYMAGLDPTQLEYFMKSAMLGETQSFFICQNDPGFSYDPASKENVYERSFAATKCIANFANGSALPFSGELPHFGKNVAHGEGPGVPGGPGTDRLMFNGVKFDDYDSFLNAIHLAANGIMPACVTNEMIEMPQNLKDFIAQLKAAGLGDHADLADRLFRQGLGQVEPTGEMGLAAQPIADQVINHMKPMVLPHLANDPAANAAKDFDPELVWVSVVRTGPGAQGYPIKITKAPAALVDPFAQYPHPVKVEVIRLYGEALKAAGPNADEDSVANALVAAVGGLGSTPDEIANKVPNVSVDGVDMNGNQATAVRFKDRIDGTAPTALRDRLGIHNTPFEYVVNFIWKQVTDNLVAQGMKEIDSKLVAKLVDDLVKKLKPGGQLMGLAVMQAQRVTNVDPQTGAVTLTQAPNHLFGSARNLDLKKLKLPAQTTIQYSIGMHQVLMEIYIAALKADPNLNPGSAAVMVDAAASKVLAPATSGTPDGAEAVRIFMGKKFGGFGVGPNGEATVELVNRDGTSGNPNGSWELTTDSGWKLVAQGGFSGKIGAVVGVDKPKNPDAKPGNETVYGDLVGGFKFGFGKEGVGNFTISSAILAYGYPTIFAPGQPNGDQNVSTSLTAGDGWAFRLQELAIGYDNEWKGDTTFGLNLKLGHIGVRPGDGTGLGMNGSMQPINSFQPFTQKSSISDGGKVEGTAAWGPFKSNHGDNDTHTFKLTVGGVLGTALSAIQHDSDGGMVDSAGFRYGGYLQGDFDVSKGFDNTDWMIRVLLVGAQSSSGEYNDVEDALSGYSLLFGGSTMVQPHEHIKLGAGGTYGVQDNKLEGTVKRIAFGGYLAAPFNLEDKNMTLTPGFGIGYGKVWTNDRDPGGSGTVGTAGGCTDGYDCGTDGTADISDNGTGGYGSVTDLPFIMAGNSVLELNPNFRLDWGATNMFTGIGLNTMRVKNVQTEDVDWVWMPYFTLGREW